MYGYLFIDEYFWRTDNFEDCMIDVMEIFPNASFLQSRYFMKVFLHFT
jgi:hypothetical protein